MHINVHLEDVDIHTPTTTVYIYNRLCIHTHNNICSFVVYKLMDRNGRDTNHNKEPEKGRQRKDDLNIYIYIYI